MRRDLRKIPAELITGERFCLNEYKKSSSGVPFELGDSQTEADMALLSAPRICGNKNMSIAIPEV